MERVARTKGYRVAWAPPIVIDSPGAELDFDLEFVLAHLMLKKKDIFFVQIGANDGMTIDPLYKFVTEFGWNGILVEPIPKAFALLKANYKDQPGLRFLNAAVAQEDGRRTMYSVRVDGDAFEKADIYSSFDRELVSRQTRWVPDVAQRIEEVEVPCISMDTLLEQAGGRTVDVLTMDVEGFDYEVLKMIDFSKLRPAVISYEHANLSRVDREAAAGLLVGQGYRMTRDNLDTIAYRPGFTYGWRSAGA